MGDLIHRYHLKFKNKDGGVEGILWQRNGAYACLQAMPQFGDAPLEEQIQALKRGETTLLIEQSRKALALDASFRERGESAFKGLQIPRSNYLLLSKASLTDFDKALERGFDTFKCKFLPDEELLNRHSVSWRIDPNSSLQEIDLCQWWQSLSDSAKEKIELIEDPCPYGRELYQRLAQEIPIAIDWHWQRWLEEPFPVHALIIKPAAVDAFELLEKAEPWVEKAVVTSYMDHPLGQSYAAVVAGQLKEKYPNKIATCGFGTHAIFEENEFSQALGKLTAEFQRPPGTGLGFDEQLQNLNWQELK